MNCFVEMSQRWKEHPAFCAVASAMTIAQAEGVAGLTWCRFRFMLQFLDGPLALNLLLISVMTLSLELARLALETRSAL